MQIRSYLFCIFATCCCWLHANDSLSEIATEWNRQFGIAIDDGVYHYRCRIEQHVNEKEASQLGLSDLESARYTLEVQRLADSHRWRIYSPEIADTWIEAFDGTTKFVSQNGQDWSIYTDDYLKEHPIQDRYLMSDPLQDVLGLGLATQVSTWTLRTELTNASTDLVSALTTNDSFAVLKHTEQMIELVSEVGGRVELTPVYGSSILKREWTTDDAPELRFLLSNSEWKEMDRHTWYPTKSILRCEIPSRESQLYTLEYTFTLLDRVSESDFDVTVDRVDSDIFWHGASFENGDFDYRHRRIRRGDSIDLVAVAHGADSIRWDVRSWPPFTLFDAWNLIPLGLVVVPCLTIWRNRLSNSQPVLAMRLSRLALMLGVAFVILLHAGMFTFPGGTLEDADAHGYSMTRNFLSDLGREFALNASENSGSAMCFTVSLSLASAALLCVAWMIPWQFESQVTRRISIVASCLATIAAWFFLRTGWTPIDQHFEAHQSYAMLGFSALGISTFVHAIALFVQGSVSKTNAGALLVLFCAITLYLLLRQFDDERILLGSTWLFRQATAQKLVLYSSIACLFVQLRSSFNWVSDQNSKRCGLE